MKRWIVLLGIVIGTGAVLYFVQRHKVEAPVGPQAVLNAIAESERDATRVPARVTRISDEEEIRDGDNIARRYESRWMQRPRNQEVEAYLTTVGQKLIPYTKRKLPYKFHYIDDPWFVNAFALPGGHIFMGSGLMSLMDSEDELAAVLAHEIEHVDHYHCAERLQTEATLRKLSIAGLIASIPVELFEAGYTKEQESESDRDGTYIAYRAGYSATGALRMFEAFQKFDREATQTKAGTPAAEAARVVDELLSGYFRSHPFASEREQAIRKLISDENWPARAELDIHVDCSAARKKMETVARVTIGEEQKPKEEASCRMKPAKTE